MSELVIFEQKQVRRIRHAEAWWFVIVDVVAALLQRMGTTCPPPFPAIRHF
jgi:prophage antirepressor-like protein